MVAAAAITDASAATASAGEAAMIVISERETPSRPSTPASSDDAWIRRATAWPSSTIPASATAAANNNSADRSNDNVRPKRARSSARSRTGTVGSPVMRATSARKAATSALPPRRRTNAFGK